MDGPKPGIQADDDDQAAEQHEGTVTVMMIDFESRHEVLVMGCVSLSSSGRGQSLELSYSAEVYKSCVPERQ